MKYILALFSFSMVLLFGNTVHVSAETTLQEDTNIACSCDGIQASSIFPGQSVSVTAFGKVTGDVFGTTINTMRFFFAEDTTVLAQSGPIQTRAATKTANFFRYKAVWKYTLPKSLNPDAQYRFWNTITCNSAIASTRPTQQSVLSSTTQNPNIFDNLFQVISNFIFFQTGNSNNQSSNTSPPDQERKTTEKMQIGAFYPLDIFVAPSGTSNPAGDSIITEPNEKTCTFFMFTSQVANN